MLCRITDIPLLANALATALFTNSLIAFTNSLLAFTNALSLLAFTNAIGWIQCQCQWKDPELVVWKGYVLGDQKLEHGIPFRSVLRRLGSVLDNSRDKPKSSLHEVVCS